MKILLALLAVASLISCTNPNLERAALGALSGAADGFAQGGKDKALSGAASGLAKALQPPAAKQPVDVQP